MQHDIWHYLSFYDLLKFFFYDLKPPAEKEVWMDRAEADKARYLAELQQYQVSMNVIYFHVFVICQLLTLILYGDVITYSLFH